MLIEEKLDIYNMQSHSRLVFQPMEGCDGTEGGAIYELTKRIYLRVCGRKSFDWISE